MVCFMLCNMRVCVCVSVCECVCESVCESVCEDCLGRGGNSCTPMNQGATETHCILTPAGLCRVPPHSRMPLSSKARW